MGNTNETRKRKQKIATNNTKLEDLKKAIVKEQRKTMKSYNKLVDMRTSHRTMEISAEMSLEDFQNAVSSVNKKSLLRLETSLTKMLEEVQGALSAFEKHGDTKISADTQEVWYQVSGTLRDWVKLNVESSSDLVDIGEDPEFVQAAYKGKVDVVIAEIDDLAEAAI